MITLECDIILSFRQDAPLCLRGIFILLATKQSDWGRKASRQIEMKENYNSVFFFFILSVHALSLNMIVSDESSISPVSVYLTFSPFCLFTEGGFCIRPPKKPTGWFFHKCIRVEEEGGKLSYTSQQWNVKVHQARSSSAGLLTLPSLSLVF